MPVPELSLLGLKRIRGFVSILHYINPTIIIIIKDTVPAFCENQFQYKTSVVAPEFVLRLEAFEEVCAGGSVTFQCQWKACPRPQIKWFKDDEEITTDHPYFTVSHILILPYMVCHVLLLHCKSCYVLHHPYRVCYVTSSLGMLCYTNKNNLDPIHKNLF